MTINDFCFNNEFDYSKLKICFYNNLKDIIFRNII